MRLRRRAAMDPHPERRVPNVERDRRLAQRDVVPHEKSQEERRPLARLALRYNLAPLPHAVSGYNRYRRQARAFFTKPLFRSLLTIVTSVWYCPTHPDDRDDRRNAPLHGVAPPKGA